MEAASGRSFGFAALPLQFCETSPGTEIRIRDEDAGNASGSGQAAADVQGDLLIGNRFLGVEESRLPVQQVEQIGQCHSQANAFGSLTTFGEGSTQSR